MPKPKFLFLCLILSAVVSFAQPQKHAVVISEKVEVIEYEYEYFYIEYATAVSFSSFYPLYQLNSPSGEQLFFEDGKNERLGFEAGIQQSIKIDRWSFSTGLEYQQINEYFSYGEYQTREVEIQNNSGENEIISVAIGEAVVTTHLNQLGYLKIPVQINYQLKLLKSGLCFSAGMNYHRLIFSNYFTKFSLNKPAEALSNQYFNSSYFSFSGGFSITKNINETIKMKIGPYFNYGLSNLIDQDNLSYGLSYFGINLTIVKSY